MSIKSKKMSGGEFFKKYGIVVVLLALIAFFTIMRPTFILPDNLLEIMRQVSFTGIIAVGMTFCLLTGGLDLSVGSNMAFGVMIAGIFMAAAPIPVGEGMVSLNPLIGCILGILATTGVGLLNGFFVNEIKIPPLIVTLATLEMIRGIVYVLTGAIPIYEGMTPEFTFLGQGSIGVVPFPVIVMAAVFIIGGIVLSKTVYGRHIYCVGGSQEVARLSGIKVKKIKYSVYAISGMLAGVAAILLLSRMNSAQPRAGISYEFEVVTACVLGGISIAGGEGKISGAFFGVVIMGVLFNGLIQIGLSEFYQMIIKGIVLLIAVGIDAMSHAKKEKLTDLKKAEEEKNPPKMQTT